jgi:fumarate reductase subunit C
MKGKEYVRPMPATWWLHNIHLKLFMIRELTSLFVAGYAVFLVVLISHADDPKAFTDTVLCPTAVVFQIIALPFVIFHSVTWFNLTPKAIVLFRGEERVSPRVIAGAHYFLWAALSLVILLLVL